MAGSEKYQSKAFGLSDFLSWLSNYLFYVEKDDAGEKRDRGMYTDVLKMLGTAGKSVGEQDSIHAFNPSYDQLEDILKLMKDELPIIKEMGTDWQPHPTGPLWMGPVEGPYRFEHAEELPADLRYLSEDALAEEYALCPEKFGQFYKDTNVDKICREFYSPWLAIYLFHLAIKQLVPMVNRKYIYPVSIMQSEPVLPPSSKGRVKTLWMRGFGQDPQAVKWSFLKSIAWSCSIGIKKSNDRYKRTPAVRIADQMKTLWQLHDLLQFPEYQAYSQIGDVAESSNSNLLEAVVRLGEPELYFQNKEQLDAAYRFLWEQYDRMPPDDDVRTHLRNAVFESFNSARLISISIRELKEKLKGPEAKEVLDDAVCQVMENAIMALETYNPESGVTFSYHLYQKVLRDPWSRAAKIIKRNKKRTLLTRGEDGVALTEQIAAHIPGDDPLTAYLQLESLQMIPEMIRASAFTVTQQKLIMIRLQVLEEFKNNPEVTEKQLNAEIASRAKMSIEFYYVHASDIRKRLKRTILP